MRLILLFTFICTIPSNIFSQTTREIFAARDKLHYETEPVDYYVTSKFKDGNNHRIVLFTMVKAYYGTDLTWLEDNHKHYRDDYDGHKLESTSIILSAKFKQWKKDQKNTKFVERYIMDYRRLGRLDTVNLAKLPYYFASTTDSVHTVKIKFTDGSYYNGDLIYGIKNGKGKYVWNDSTYYLGDWWHDKRTGYGKVKYKNGAYYVGQFDDGTLTGKGVYHYADSSTFEGFFIEAKREGSGIYIFPDKTSKKGIWKNDSYVEGSADQYNPDEKFIAPFKPILLSNDKYVGEKKNGKYHGKGTYYFMSGAIYEGSFLNDKFHGSGKFIYTDGSYFIGEYVDGKMNGLGKLYNYDGSLKFEGNYVENLRVGIGKSYFSDGSTYEGEFKNDTWEGKGKYTFKSGNYYEGEVSNGMFNGIGTMYYMNGTKTKCKYIDGKCMEEIKD